MTEHEQLMEAIWGGAEPVSSTPMVAAALPPGWRRRDDHTLTADFAAYTNDALPGLVIGSTGIFELAGGRRVAAALVMVLHTPGLADDEAKASLGVRMFGLDGPVAAWRTPSDELDGADYYTLAAPLGYVA